MAVSTASTAGIIAGFDPLEYLTSQPYTLLLFQMVVILTFAQIVNFPLSVIRQPRVIGEVITGILLGPSVMGHIPNFTNKVFPTASIPGLTDIANIGVYLLLFMVGCEVDTTFIRKHLKIALTVGIFNMAVPFALGCAVSVGLWNEYRKNDDTLQPIEFTTYMVFIAVAMCITAFPVLARILTELNLIRDKVGTIVLAAGITNDLIGWILLALSITLANSTSSITTLYICLVTIGWCLFCVYPLRYLLRYILTKNGDLENPNGPSQFSTALILIMMLSSAFFTDIIGVHPIFGAFIIGAIVPRENGYVVRLAEKIEDLVNLVLVPLYFALAGLGVNLGLLNQGIDWAYIVCIVVVALVGKVFGGFVASKVFGLYKRESLAVGVLMSCKGIVEIVVLNTGLNAGILSQKTYSMFIVMALVATFVTTPLTLLVYPQSYRDKVKELRKQAEESASKSSMVSSVDEIKFQRLVLPVNELETISTGLVLLDYICEPTKLPVLGVNVKVLTQRTADLLQASMLGNQSLRFDKEQLNPLLSILKVFSDLNSIPFSSEILFSMPGDYFKTMIASSNCARNDLLMLTVSNKEYLRNPDLVAELAQLSSPTDVHKCLLINNNQELAKTADVDYTDGDSIFSKETILNPESLHFTTLTLVLSNTVTTSQDLVALKLFFLMAEHRDIALANVCVRGDSELLGLVQTHMSLVKDEHVTLTVHESVAAFEEHLAEKHSSMKGNVNDLVIIANNSDSEQFCRLFVSNNDRLVITY
ncbi:hypothetical protein OGAPHI_003699 [Ogataea philodendri]|uniref:Cation/H+ exchanger transmembrane domain-containing protein n=1 Tax=Ogataea philodendri TaxID=1378263 RepID=A0A9P8P475_9ASCO|nr:uncharacterized protein OGAPHI_003699 [Ogataea philodendri]KAH3665513.1 hypothetical protein OGAPHI_003699 [Ogataea philodendri]